MKIVEYPERETWGALLRRPVIDARELGPVVSSILEDVRENGDDAVRRCAAKFDGFAPDELVVSARDIAQAEAYVPHELRRALAAAKANIEKFHAVNDAPLPPVETSPGVLCWKKRLPIEKVGLYVPAGSAPLFSTVLMLAIPARLAGCRDIVMCSPPARNGKVDPTTLYAAALCGVTRVCAVGGAQAIAALGFGTASVPAVYKIFGPGNQYVTEAKLQIMRQGVAIDMPAGPSELAVLADETCVPAFVAADLLSQAEHGQDSQVVLVSTSRSVIGAVMSEISRQIGVLDRRSIAESALRHSTAILVDSLDTGIDLVNEYAAEHLIIAVDDAESAAGRITNAGSVFIGNFSSESAGDYASGTNHALPTNGAARAYSGVSVSSFTKTITYQQLDEVGVRTLGPVIEAMAEAEGLGAHRAAVSLRRDHLSRQSR